MQSNGLFWLLEHKSFGGASWGFARLHRSFRLMFADGQCSVISSAGAWCRAGGTAADASCGCRIQPFICSHFSWRFRMVLGKQNGLAVQEFGVGVTF